MQINYHVTGAERKRLVKAISSYIGCEAKYLGVPSCAYQVDCFTIDREGRLSFDDCTDSEMVEGLLGLLHDEGFEPVPSEMIISVPVEFDRSQTYENVTALISSKQTLIKRALGIEATPVEQTDKGFDFPWFGANATPAEQLAYRQFVAALVKTAAKLKRVNPTEREVENGKYEFRCFLLRLGSLVVDWDNGCGLNVIYGEDVVKKLDSVTVITYGQKQIWDSRAEAIAFYLEGMMNCEGAERDRYTNIYLALISGAKVSKDEPDEE